MVLMKINNLITLKDNTNYLLLEEIQYENKKYFFCVKVDEEKTKPINDYVFLKEETIHNKESVKIIKDSKLIEILYNIILKNFINS